MRDMAESLKETLRAQLYIKEKDNYELRATVSREVQDWLVTCLCETKKRKRARWKCEKRLKALAGNKQMSVRA